MISHPVNKTDKRIIACVLSGMLILSVLMSTVSLASAQDIITPTPEGGSTDTVTPMVENTLVPTAQPTQPQETAVEPTFTQEPGLEMTPEPSAIPSEVAGDLPNLIFSAPEGWDAPVILSSQPGTHTQDSLTHGEQEYLDVAVLNTGAEIAVPFSICLNIIDQQVHCWSADRLAGGEYFLVEDWPYTADRGNGSHYFEIIADVDNKIAEIDETDNAWASDFYWQPSDLDSQSIGSPLINDAFIRPPLMDMGIQGETGSNAPGYLDTSLYMIGSVAVGVIMPESAGNTENWTAQEITNVTSEIQEGINRWSAWSSSSGDFVNKDPVNANVSFAYEFLPPKSTSVEPIALSSDNQCIWISEILAGMGFTNPNGCGFQLYDYLADLRTRHNTDWATLIFVVDSSSDDDGMFADGYFGYAYLHGPMIVMTYDNDGWGIGSMDQVVQHEMGHIFGAGDNYYQAGYGGCTSTTEKYGYLGIANSNCQYGNPYAIKNVLMNQNTIDRNHWTAQYQVGWRDRDDDLIPDILDTQPIFTMNPISKALTITGVVYDPAFPGSGKNVTINKITSARFRIDAGEWAAISALDGAFNSDYEQVSFVLPGTESGLHTLSVEVTSSSGNTSLKTFDLKLPNDRIAAPIVIKAGNTYTANTYWAGVTPDEPKNVCNENDTRSVWYRFYAPTKGIYQLDVKGSGYSPNLTVVKKGSGTVYTPVVCGDTDASSIDTSTLSFNAAAGATYLIGVSSNSEINWDLSISISKLTCPTGNLCGAAIGGDGKVIHNPFIKVLNTNGSQLKSDQGNFSGFVSTAVSTPGSYTIVTSGRNSLIVQNKVLVPGIYLPSAVGLPKTNIVMLDKTGTEIAADEIILTSVANNSISGFMDGTIVGKPLTLYTPAGKYNLFSVSDASNMLVYRSGISIVSSINPGSISMDTVGLSQDTFSFTPYGFSSGSICFSTQDLSGVCISANKNREITFAAPQNTAISFISLTINAVDLSNNQWRYKIRLSNLPEDRYIHGSYTHSFQIGGDLKVLPYLNNNPVRLDEGRGYIFGGVTDYYGHPVFSINYSTDSLYFSSIGPSYNVTNPSGSIAQTGHIDGVGDYFRMPFSLTDPTGTWTINETLEAGPMGGTVNGSNTFTAYSLTDHPLVNDDFDNATIIPTITNSGTASITALDTSGGTRALDDPLLPGENTRGYATSWFKYVAGQDALLIIDSDTSNYNTFLAVWQGVRGSLAKIAYNNDYTDPETKTTRQTSRLEVPIRQGQTYYIEAAHYPIFGFDDAFVQSQDISSADDGDISAQSIGGTLNLLVTQRPCFTLSTASSPAASGKVRVSPAANCLGTKYIEGTEITLTAVPNARIAFSAWSNLVILNPYSFNISEDTTLQAAFVPLAVPVLTSPANGLITKDNTPTFNWNPTAGLRYEIQIDNQYTFTAPIEKTAIVTDPAYTPDTSLSDGIKYWRVRSLGRYGELGAWTAYRTIRVDTVAPAAPALRSPVNSATVRGMPLFYWNAVAGANTYFFQYDDNSDFSSPVLTTGALKTVSYRPTGEPLGTFYWRVQAGDAAGNLGPWSSARIIVIIPPITLAPNLVSPISGGYVDPITRLVSWKTVPYGVQYQIQVNKSYTFGAGTMLVDEKPAGASNLPPSELSVSGADIEAQVPEYLNYSLSALADGKYYWRVRAWNASNEPGRWSAYRIVRKDTVAPAAPVLKAPADNGNVLAARPVLSVTALPAGANFIRFQLDDVNTFESPIDVKVAAAGYTLTPAQALSFGTWYWRACAVDAAGNTSGWTAARSFLVTILKTPANLSSTMDTTPTFSWAAWPGALNYHLQIDDSAAFDSPYVDEIRPISYTFTPAKALTPGTWYWRMQVKTAAGWGIWTSSNTFSINAP